VLTYIAKRLLIAAPTLLAVLTVVFFFVRIAPGDPAMIILGDQASQPALAAMRHQLGLDQPIAAQYVEFLGQVLQGDLGASLVTRQRVWSEVAGVLPYTIDLTLTALAIGVVLGLPLGIVAARRRNGAIDYLARFFSLTGLSFPAFVSAILLLLAFAIELRWFPVISEARSGDPLDQLRALTLPAVNLGLIMVAYVMRVARSSMLGVLGEDYIRTARAKGAPERSVTYHHALRNAILPVVTVIGIEAAFLMGGLIVTETVFNIPGVARFLVEAIKWRDYPIVQNLVMFVAVVAVSINFIIDMLYAVLDPRIKYAD
jgi:ABC-type dipeptide/oligopeptide/nickel transport system permease component